MSDERTQWFGLGTKPARPGVYETVLVSDSGWHFAQKYSRWTGHAWMDSNNTICLAQNETMKGLQSKMWRGLTEAGHLAAIKGQT